MIFDCAFICPEVLTVVGGPGDYPGLESSIYTILKRTYNPGGHAQSRRQIATFERPYLGLKTRNSTHYQFRIVELCQTQHGFKALNPLLFELLPKN